MQTRWSALYVKIARRRSTRNESYPHVIRVKGKQGTARMRGGSAAEPSRLVDAIPMVGYQIGGSIHQINVAKAFVGPSNEIYPKRSTIRVDIRQ